MNLSCVVCGAKHVLLLILLEKSNNEGDMTFERKTIGVCISCNHAQLEIYTYDRWPTEDQPEMFWMYSLDPPDTKTLKKMVEACPDQQNPKCNCQVHNGLRSSVENLLGGRANTSYRYVKLEVADGVPSLMVDPDRFDADIACKKQN